jgi:colanic acid/amylovoran biosynthesis protein
MKAIQVAILGTPVTSNNRGVLALGTSIVSLFIRYAPEGIKPFLLLDRNSNKPVRLLIQGEIKNIPVINCRLSPRSRIRDHLFWIVFSSLLYRLVPFANIRRLLCKYTPWLSALEKADLVGDVRGGDSFSDIYGMERFVHGFLMAWTVILMKKRFVQLPQTYGPYNNSVAHQLARYLMKKSSIVIARDRISQGIAQAMMGPGSDVWICPDVAFSLEAIRPEKIELTPPLLSPPIEGKQSDIIGLNVNGLMANGGYNRNNMFGLKLDYRLFLSKLIEELLDIHVGELWLVPHTYGPPEGVESDPEASRQLRQILPAGLQKRVRIVSGEYDQHEIKGVIGQCDFFIGSRMHACIAALSQGIPCVGVAYSQKFEGVFESVGMADWVIDGRKFDNARAVAKVIELYHERDAIRQRLAKNANNAKIYLKNVFTKLVQSATS